MLRRKAWRDVRQNFGQFFSLFILVALATAMYAGFMADLIGGNAARATFHENAALASAWLYGEGFTEDNLAAVRALDFVEDAQLRTRVTGSAPNQGGAEIDLYLERENRVNKPLTVAGEDFDPTDPDGFWLNRNFAEAWDLGVGDDFTVEYSGVEFTKPVKGIVLSPEYEYMCASTDADTNFANIGYVFMDFDGFPVREYVLHLIENDKITPDDVRAHIDELDGARPLLALLGIDLEDVGKDDLMRWVGLMGDKALDGLMPYTQLVARGAAGEDLLPREREISDAIGGNYAAMVDASSLPGIERLTAELEQHASFSYAFMVVFMAIAVLVIMTSMSRMVARQRTQIGTMNALGLSRAKIARHYLSYSFGVSLAGGVVGMLCGYFLLGRWIVSLFREWYVVPGWEAGADWSFALVPAVVTALCVLSAWISCRRLLRVAPSEALRPAPPREGRRTLFERLPFWEKLGFSARYNLRDISRHKLRAVMGIFGTAVGMLLLTGTVAALTLLNDVYDWTFVKIQNFEYEAMLTEDMKLADADRLRADMDGELVMQAAIEIAREPNAVGADKSTQGLTVIEGRGLYRITDVRAQVTELPEGTAAITRRLAEKLGVGVGDTVYWHIYEQNAWHESVIGAINRTPESSGLTLLRADFEAAGCEFTPSLLATNDAAIRSLEHEGVSTVYGISELRAIYEQSMQIIWALVVAMVIFAVVMIVAVLYNSGNLSFNERVQEFATLKVLGLSTERIRALLARQNLWLSMIGIVLGAPFGRTMLEAMMNSNGENFDYYATVAPRDYLVAGAVVLLVSVAVSFLFTRKIRDLDMVGTLKGAE